MPPHQAHWYGFQIDAPTSLSNSDCLLRPIVSTKKWVLEAGACAEVYGIYRPLKGPVARYTCTRPHHKVIVSTCDTREAFITIRFMQSYRSQQHKGTLSRLTCRAFWRRFSTSFRPQPRTVRMSVAGMAVPLAPASTMRRNALTTSSASLQPPLCRRRFHVSTSASDLLGFVPPAKKSHQFSPLKNATSQRKSLPEITKVASRICFSGLSALLDTISLELIDTVCK